MYQTRITIPIMLTVLAFLAGCAPTAARQMASAAYCPKLETGAAFSCWWSGDNAPLTHCVLQAEDNPACKIKQKAAAYFDRGAYIQRATEDQERGTWIVLRVFEDEQGRIGQRATSPSGQYSLTHHSESASRAEATPVTEPRWPRWPIGIELGPDPR